MLDNGREGFIEEIVIDILVYISVFTFFFIDGKIYGQVRSWLDILALIIVSGIFLFIAGGFIRLIRFWKIFKISIPLHAMSLIVSSVVMIVYAELSFKYRDSFAIGGFTIFLVITLILVLKLRHMKSNGDWDRQTRMYEDYKLRSMEYPRKRRMIMDFPAEMIDAVRRRK